MNKNAVCITVYNHRKSSMLENIGNIDSTKYDVYIIAQLNDPCKDEYFQYTDNVLFPDVTSIFQKREFIRTEMTKRGYDGYFMIDDDVNYAAYHITPETKRTTSDSYRNIKVDFNDMLNRMVEVCWEYDAGYTSVIRIGYLGFEKPGRVKVNATINVAQIGYFRVDKLEEHNIHYDTTGYINEDFDIVMQLLQHGVNCCTVCDYSFTVSNVMYKNMDTTTLYESLEDNFRLFMHKYIKYHTPLFLDTKGFLRQRTSYKKYFNTFELPPADPAILRLCESDDVKGLVDYLILTGKNKIRV